MITKIFLCVLTGLCLGGFFYAVVLENDWYKKIDKPLVMAEMFALAGGVVFSLVEFDFAVLVTLVVMLFNAIMDYKTRTVSTLVTYSGVFLVAAYKMYKYISSAFLMKYIILIVITAIILRIVSKLSKEYIGEGDLDIIFLLILSLGHFGFMHCLFYTSLIGTYYAAFKRLGRKTKIPMVPFLYSGYLIALITQGGVIL